MKKVLFSLAIVATSLSSFAALKGGVETYKVDTEKSSITWLGKKLTGEHKGTVKLNSGALQVAGDKISGGNFVADLGSIKTTDLTGEWATKLENHLKAEDFFDVAKHPTAKFVVSSIEAAGEKATIHGKLTIKEVTKDITFPAIVKVKNGVVVAVAQAIKINRTDFGIKYGSKSFFPDLGDKVIEDEFELGINLVAKK